MSSVGTIPQKIALVGASGRAAAYSAKQAGFEVCVADYFSDQDTQSIASVQTISSYQDQLIPWLKQTQPSGWIYVGGIENYPDLIDQADKITPLYGNSSIVLNKVRDPFYLQALLNDHSLRFPETLRNAKSTMRDAGWLGKKQDSAGGLGVIDYENIPLDQHGDYYFQQRIDGDLLSASFLAADDQVVLLGISRQLVGDAWNTPLPYQYAGSIHAGKLLEELSRELNAIAQVLTQATGIQGLFGIDFIVQDGRCVVLEINPRYTASMELIEAARQSSLIGAHASVFTNSGINGLGSIKDENHRGKLFLFAQQDFTFEVQLYEQLKQAVCENSSELASLPTMADIPQVGTPINQGDPIFTIFSEASDEAEVEYLLKIKAKKCQLLINEYSS
ncbi:MAG: hypothetical protein COA78_33660 [Blastopirellula sp.]|nr:MAG: hypothetical protein COA78_33660 [Blastopirellula sp.]